MKYPSPADIEEMRARGYDASVIAEAVARSSRWSEKEQVKRVVESAFLGVILGSGVGLNEADAIASYADEETRSRARMADEQYDWRLIPASALDREHLSFVDAEGMRFHLPAYLRADLDLCAEHDGADHFGLVPLLTDHTGDERFAMLDANQRAAVASFLGFMLGELPEDERPWVEVSIKSRWAAHSAS